MGLFRDYNSNALRSDNFFKNNSRQKYDPQIISESAAHALGTHKENSISAREVRPLRAVASLYALNEYGVDIPPQKFEHAIKQSNCNNSEFRDEVIAYYRKEKSIERTAKHFRIAPQSVRKALKENGFNLNGNRS